MTQTTERPTTKPPAQGFLGALRDSPATKSLLDETKNLAKAGGAHLVGRTAQRLTSSTEKLHGLAERNGKEGKLSPLAEGVQRLVKGEPPTKTAFRTVASAMREKAKGALKIGRGKRGGKSGPLKATNIEETVDVGVPVSVAYDQWTQFPDFARFMKGVEAVEAKSETEQNWRVKVFKSRRSWKATVQEQIPDRRIAWTSEGGKGSTRGAVTFHPLADDLTRILLAIEYYPSGFVERTGNIWRAGGRRARLDLKHFRRFIMMQGKA
ncbi:SRPBCC family protein, partial [Frankia sp. CcWB2]